MKGASTGSREPRVIATREMNGQRIETPGFQRTVTKLLETVQMTVHIAVFEPGQAGSFHVHARSEEVTYVIEGVGAVTAGDRTLALRQGDLFYGPANLAHQFRNTSEDLFITLSTYSPPAEMPLEGNVDTSEASDEEHAHEASC